MKKLSPGQVLIKWLLPLTTQGATQQYQRTACTCACSGV